MIAASSSGSDASLYTIACSSRVASRKPRASWLWLSAIAFSSARSRLTSF